MGNRAVITTKDKDIGVYLHWNGNRENIEDFLAYCDMKGYRPPDVDNYGWARLCQVIGNTIGGTLSLGIDRYEKEDTNNGDNGVYIIKNWDIVGREYFDSHENHEDDILRALEVININMPENEQVPAEDLVSYANKWNKKHKDYFKDGKIPKYTIDDLNYTFGDEPISKKEIGEMLKNLEKAIEGQHDFEDDEHEVKLEL